MSKSIKHPSFSFHIESGEPQGNVVAASVLVQILHSAQQAFELIGVHVEGRTINQRARVPMATSQRFQLICQLPQPGCFAMPVVVGGDTDLFDPESANRAFAIFRTVMERVTARNTDGLANALPDERVRRRVLEAVKGMAPRADAKWTLDLHDSDDTPFASFDVATIPFVQNTLVPAEQREASLLDEWMVDVSSSHRSRSTVTNASFASNGSFRFSCTSLDVELPALTPSAAPSAKPTAATLLTRWRRDKASLL